MGDFARIKAILNPQYSKLFKDYLRFDEKDEEAQTIFHVVVRTGDANLIRYIFPPIHIYTIVRFISAIPISDLNVYHQSLFALLLNRTFIL